MAHISTDNDLYTILVHYSVVLEKQQNLIDVLAPTTDVFAA